MSKIVATVTKETAETKVGLALFRNDPESPLLISLIREGGLFSATDLAPGMLALQINGTDVTGCTSKEAAEILRTAEAGDVTVVAKAAVGQAHKESADVSCGISLQRQEGKGIVITKIRDDGLFASSELAPGLRLSAINGNKCPATTKEAIAMLKGAVGDLTVVAYDPEWAVVEPEEEDAAEEEEEEAAKPEDPVKEEEEEEPAQEQAPAPEDEPEESPEQTDRALEKKEKEEGSSILDSLCTMCA